MGGGGEGGCVSDGGASFLSRGAPQVGEASILMGSFSKKFIEWGGGEGAAPYAPHYGNPEGGYILITSFGGGIGKI